MEPVPDLLDAAVATALQHSVEVETLSTPDAGEPLVGALLPLLTPAASARGAVVGSRTMPRSLAVGVDVGGTKVAALLTDDRGTVLDRQVVHSPADDAEATVDTVVALARDLANRHEGVVAVGVGAAGLVSRDGVLRFAPNLAWREFPSAIGSPPASACPVIVDNDANGGGWGEFRFGAGRGTEDLLLVTVGTGIGGGIVAGGSLFHGAHGFAAEIGHIIVEPGGPPCGCGNVGCWEQVASGRAIERLGREAAARAPRLGAGKGGAGAPGHHRRLGRHEGRPGWRPDVAAHPGARRASAWARGSPDW